MKTKFYNIGATLSSYLAWLVEKEIEVRGKLETNEWRDFALDVGDRATIKQIAMAIAGIIGDFSLPVAGFKAFQLQTEMGDECAATTAQAHMRALKETVLLEMSNVQFLRVTKDMVECLDKEAPFGEAICAAFPACVEDIAEAHQCFAFGRYTASMFHLGRVMELGVKRVAQEMQVTPSRDDWQSFLKGINEAVERMPYKTTEERERRAPFAEAAGYLFHFKEAWRNPTMHPKRTYTREEALNVLNGANAFLNYVVRFVIKPQMT